MSARVTREYDRDIEMVFEHVRPRLRACASTVVGWDDAEDVVQEAFVRALAFPGAFRHDASMTTWMTRIVMNAAIDETRRRTRRPRTVPRPDVAKIDCSVMPHYPQRLELKTALAAMRRSDRELLVLAGLLGLSYKETARRLGLTVATTKSRLWTARRRLRRAMTGVRSRPPEGRDHVGMSA
jgi:RNA polymerase sigma-70 factor, ECF subfamily